MTLIMLSLWIAFSCSSPAQMSDHKVQEEQLARETLRGLPGVAVMIEDLAPMAEQKGLSKVQLRTDVERALSQAEIRVLSEEERQSTPGNPMLSVRVTIFHIGTVYCLHIEVSVKQMMTLKRAPNLDRLATTWQTRVMGASAVFDVAGLHGVVLGKVGEFIAAYRAVNPGERRAMM